MSMTAYICSMDYVRLCVRGSGQTCRATKGAQLLPAATICGSASVSGSAFEVIRAMFRSKVYICCVDCESTFTARCAAACRD